MKKLLMAILALVAGSALATTTNTAGHIVLYDGTNLYTSTTTAYTNLGSVNLAATNSDALGGVAAGSHFLNDGTRQLTGNVRLNGNWLSGDGDGEGITVDSAGLVTINGYPSWPDTFRQVFGSKIDAYQCTNAAGGTSFNLYRAGGTYTTPGVASNAYNGAFNLRAWDGYAWRIAGQLMFELSATATSNSTPGQISMLTVPPAGGAYKYALTVQSDRSVLLYNVSGGPATPSGGALLYATNAEMWVMDGSGNKTQISPHNDRGEWTPVSENVYSGVRELVNQTILAKAIESLLPMDSPYKGKVYSVVTNTPTANWNDDQARFEAERNAAIARWDATPVADREGPRPEPYVKKPEPDWLKAITGGVK